MKVIYIISIVFFGIVAIYILIRMIKALNEIRAIISTLFYSIYIIGIVLLIASSGAELFGDFNEGSCTANVITRSLGYLCILVYF